MPLPDRLARINRRVTNPLARSLAGRLPPFAVVVHRGRRSGKEYRTPVWAFPTGDGVVIALPYGENRDWIRNVQASGGCTVIRRGHPHRMTEPRLLSGDAGLRLMPRLVQPVLRRLWVSTYLTLRAGSGGSTPRGW